MMPCSTTLFTTDFNILMRHSASRAVVAKTNVSDKLRPLTIIYRLCWSAGSVSSVGGI